MEDLTGVKVRMRMAVTVRYQVDELPVTAYTSEGEFLLDLTESDEDGLAFAYAAAGLGQTLFADAAAHASKGLPSG